MKRQPVSASGVCGQSNLDQKRSWHLIGWTGILLGWLLPALLWGQPVWSEERLGGKDSPGNSFIYTNEPETYRMLLPLVLHKASASCGVQPVCEVLVQVVDEGGNPIEGVLIVAFYMAEQGEPLLKRAITDEQGQARFSSSLFPITFEVQFPAGYFPCPGFPPRVQVQPHETYIKFVGCRP